MKSRKINTSMMLRKSNSPNKYTEQLVFLWHTEKSNSFLLFRVSHPSPVLPNQSPRKVDIKYTSIRLFRIQSREGLAILKGTQRVKMRRRGARSRRFISISLTVFIYFRDYYETIKIKNKNSILFTLSRCFSGMALSHSQFLNYNAPDRKCRTGNDDI
jgi:hypothetical protein